MSLRFIGAVAAALGVVTAAAFAVQEHDRRDDLVVGQRLTEQRYVLEQVRASTPPARSGESRSSDRGRAGVVQVDQGWLAETAGRTAVPLPALRAYARAQLADTGGCGIGWTTLAGIGWVESHHGTIGGRTLGDDGRSSTPILGPALDGKGKFAAIRSTPSSQAWHGDTVWEHAVGPMQFLPSTWDAWATDGDGDGTADPLDLDDAAAAAARYLCASGADLATGSGWAAAVLTYNHARVYVDDVYAAASAYAARAAD
ncbi:MAG: Membrane-bound lytic murein transglycosylase B-like protein [Nocardioides sp.]|nr:Membrane-bound lytic murein transglycosylase B-like protein [Nocardioides sp.]